jgi:hypothetical protein
MHVTRKFAGWERKATWVERRSCGEKVSTTADPLNDCEIAIGMAIVKVVPGG